MKVALLTGGGDCPGLNAVIRAATRTCVAGYGCSVVGIHNGWRGLVDADFLPLNIDTVSGILPLGGTVLGTSRTNPFGEDDGPERILRNIQDYGIDAVMAIGGEDTLGVALRLHEEYGLHVVGVPKTIDNDLSGTDYTFGFDTAVQVASEAIDRLHSTAESHNRTMVVEVMGRHSGWIAVMAGIAGGADAVMIPEFPLTVEEVAELIKQRMRRGKHFSIVVVSEGAKLSWQSGREETIMQSGDTDAFGHVRLGGVANVLGQELERLTGTETRVTILGYIQRGGSPTSRDRVLATRFGVKASQMIQEHQWGMMAALRGDVIDAVPLAEAVQHRKNVPQDLFDIAKVFFG
jgi:ATP-dependent phosphofructokinase / diphosphate-dependent phosphofructokinase